MSQKLSQTGPVLQSVAYGAYAQECCHSSIVNLQCRRLAIHTSFRTRQLPSRRNPPGVRSWKPLSLVLKKRCPPSAWLKSHRWHLSMDLSWAPPELLSNAV